MREIKFRAWDNVAFQMYYPGEEDNIVFTLEDNGIVATDIIQEEEEFQTLHHLEYMQFTGLHDRNGKEIYENDVIQTEKMRYNVHGSYEGVELVYGIVKFDNGQFVIKYEEDGSKPINFGSAYHEIVGNIHEHPNLKEETK